MRVRVQVVQRQDGGTLQPDRGHYCPGRLGKRGYSQWLRMAHRPADCWAAQRRAIAALLSKPSIEAAAEVSGVGRRTLHRWLAEDATFTATLRTAQDRAIDAAVSRLAGGAGNAANVLVSIANDGAERGATRVSAARALLDSVLRMVELRDLATRVSSLESRLKSGKDGDER